jgi:putative transposase
LEVRDEKMRKIGSAGLDHGPSVIAAVGDSEALIEPFSKTLIDKSVKAKRLQRSFSRKLRENNRENFEEDVWQRKDKHTIRKKGKIIKGKKRWVKSKSMKMIENKLKIMDASLAQERKSLHGNLANRLLMMGNTFYVEKVSTKAWQKSFGRSIGNSAPAMFISLLSRKAERAGGKLTEFGTYNTRLSQTCVCGTIYKKQLSDRTHICACGVSAQRDLFSAFLARHVREETLDIRSASKEWEQGVESRLTAAMSKAIESAKDWSKRPSTLFRSSIGVRADRRKILVEA